MKVDQEFQVKPIETLYKGYRFRSRLEARWAVYFNALGLEWLYEKEGYILPGGIFYLPDFWLPRFEIFAEVKPRPFTDEELWKCEHLPNKCLLLDTALPLSNHGYYLAGLDDNPSYQSHVNGSLYLSIHLPMSASRHLWVMYDGEDYSWSEGDEAEIAARSARFEFGENGL